MTKYMLAWVCGHVYVRLFFAICVHVNGGGGIVLLMCMHAYFLQSAYM